MRDGGHLLALVEAPIILQLGSEKTERTTPGKRVTRQLQYCNTVSALLSDYTVPPESDIN
jgi:hypothetical protein